ncbi:DUF4241 domain-containing protein [Gordonia sp. PP30]|uniref:DUF4241 domain-containing protein n=1 Tax=unclassified Gordonia (in: high G+C Gram-positive bacteria) TaxID=2657482 RepID=UPI001FFFD0D4|nr:DUF4241 domain-containing protein [Gordonia sp. PP30]UQE73424.1 DUF4241 domain-containing protein [Gordonia sp. PP30]
MNPDQFHALRAGRFGGREHTVVPLGELHVRSGRLEASDPYVGLGEGLVVAVPPGTYPVAVTVVDVSDAQDGSHLRESHLSVIVAEGTPARIEFVVPEGRAPAPAGEYYGVGVDAGTVAFTDAAAVARCMPDGDWYDAVFDTGRPDSWFALMDSAEHLVAGSANIVMPGAQNGENVVLTHSGWGDGFYPVVATYDDAGRLLGVHIDTLVDDPDYLGDQSPRD